MEFVLAKAAANARAVANIASGETAPVAAAPAAKEEKEEKKDEGDTAAGLGALFG
jgi:ribosomal protein L12E/L44/L45/RPP1/RPP2